MEQVFETTFAATPDAVAALLTERAFVLHQVQRLGATAERLSIEPDPNSVLAALVATIPSPLADEVTSVRCWWGWAVVEADIGGEAACAVSGPGVRADIRVGMVLEEMPTGCRLQAHLELDVVEGEETVLREGVIRVLAGWALGVNARLDRRAMRVESSRCG